MIPRWQQWVLFCRRPFLVYPSAADKQTIRLNRGAVVQALRRGPSPHKTSVASPHPQTGHQWNAAPGILPQLTGCRAAAGWNMIRPLSKHAFHYGCVQGRTVSGNTSNWEKSSPSLLCSVEVKWAQHSFGLGDLLHAIYIHFNFVITVDNGSFIFIVKL